MANKDQLMGEYSRVGRTKKGRHGDNGQRLVSGVTKKQGWKSEKK